MLSVIDLIVRYASYSILVLYFYIFKNVLLTTKSRGGYGRHEEETKIT